MWKKPVGISKYHVIEEVDGQEKTLCGKSFFLDGRELTDENPAGELKCEECVNKEGSLIHLTV